MRRLRPLIIVIFLMVLCVWILSGCRMSIIPGSSSQDQIATQYAILQQTATLEVHETQVAAVQTRIFQLTNPESSSETAVTSTPEPASSGTADMPTSGLIQSRTPTRTLTPRPLPCNSATLIADVTIADGSMIVPGWTFTKTWRLKNTGSCTWTTDYALVFSSGDQLSGPDGVNFVEDILPGATFNISLKLKAPDEIQRYHSAWMLRSDTGQIFGVGSSRADPITVDIRVRAPIDSTSGYNLAKNYCSADWNSLTGILICPSVEGDPAGFVVRQDQPQLENGSVDDEQALLTVPQQIDDGFIRAKFPAYKVRLGDKFRTIIGCEYNAQKCDVRFRVQYQVDNGTFKTLGEWHEIYDGNYTYVDQSLDSLDGRVVNLILIVYANGSSEGDRALWLLPRIENAPTPTVTRTRTPTPYYTRTPTRTRAPTRTRTATKTPKPSPT